jgi:hypothetical protein
VSAVPPTPPVSTGSGDDQPPPPASVSPLESVTIRWLAAQAPGGLNYLLHLTGLDVKFHIDKITSNGIVQFVYLALAGIGVWKIFVSRVRAGRDPANTNVPVVKLPTFVNSLVKQ